MAMVWRSVLTLSLAATLSAQGPPTATVDFGAYSESVSNGNGLWQGLLLDGSWDPYKNGKFIGSVISFDRPTGCGVMESVGKYQEFHGGFGFLLVAGAALAQVEQQLDLADDGIVGGGGGFGSHLSYLYLKIRLVEWVRKRSCEVVGPPLVTVYPACWAILRRSALSSFGLTLISWPLSLRLGPAAGSSRRWRFQSHLPYRW